MTHQEFRDFVHQNHITVEILNLTNASASEFAGFIPYLQQSSVEQLFPRLKGIAETDFNWASEEGQGITSLLAALHNNQYFGFVADVTVPLTMVQHKGFYAYADTMDELMDKIVFDVAQIKNKPDKTTLTLTLP